MILVLSEKFLNNFFPVHVSLMLLLQFLVTATTADTVCHGYELSVHNDIDVGLLTEKPCTHVHGDIVIENLSSFFFFFFKFFKVES